MMTGKVHWEEVYKTKLPNEVSWTQEVPNTSLEFIHGFHLHKSASLIDIGGGDSKLVDYLLEEGFEDITVLDISETALQRAKKRLGVKADKVNWIRSDILDFKPLKNYDLWHDRATFHFITAPVEIAKYLAIAESCVNKFLIIGTFSEDGPTTCSGLPIKRYAEAELLSAFSNGFEKVRCMIEDHVTPFGTKQNFIFCSFKKTAIKKHPVP